MPANEVPSSMLKNVPQVLKYLEYPSTHVPQVHNCLECLECLKWLECPSVLSIRMLECLQNAYGMPIECPDGTKFWIIICPNE